MTPPRMGDTPMPPSEPFEARVVASRSLSPAVRELRFERADGRPFGFDPGQWVNLVLPIEGGDIKRAYSIASAPGHDGGRSDAPGSRFDIAVTRVTGGPGSAYLHALAEGACLRAIGPQGLFTRPPADGRASLFVGTGTGLAPLRSMVLAALEAGAREPLWILFGARREEDAIYADELGALARQHPNVRLDVTLSQPTSAWTGRRGHVQAHLAEIVGALREVSPHVEAYVCGLDRMVSAVRSVLRDGLGFERRQVHAERYD
jgi:CDP-4-dehydro-6-deoxyglucose reductase, E3